MVAQNCYTQSIYLALSAWIPLRRQQKLGYLRCPAVVEEMDPADPVGGRGGGGGGVADGVQGWRTEGDEWGIWRWREGGHSARGIGGVGGGF